MISAKKALKQLKEGNKRFCNEKPVYPNTNKTTRDTLIKGQSPFATIIACSDSRVPVELVFDAGFGELFVIRTAGNVLSDENLGSIDYAISIGVKLVLVLGHDDCGAINTALKYYNNQKNDELSPNLNKLLAHIYPALKMDEEQNNKFLKNAVEMNINFQVDLLKNYLAPKIKEYDLMVKGAKYSLETGKIEFYE